MQQQTTKYRFWETTQKIWIHPGSVAIVDGQIYFTGSTGKMCECGCCAEYLNKVDNVIPLQFTGLSDKNGKEIYQGDIVLVDSQWHESVLDDGSGPDEDYKQLCPIEFNNGVLGPKLSKDNWFTEGVHSFKEIEGNTGQYEFEIIGNRFENPELLTN